MVDPHPVCDGPHVRRPLHLLPRRPVGRAIALALVLLVGWLTWSVGGALRAPGTDPVAARLAEWARFHRLGGVVTVAEKVQYRLHPPRTGGTPAPLAAEHPGAAGDPRPRPSTPAPLAPLPLQASPALPGEGQWQVLETVAGQPAVRAAFVRPDAVHTSYLTGVARLDQRLVRLEYHAGTQVPGGTGWGLPPTVPGDRRDGLLATFNSGFLVGDSRGGTWDNGKTAGTLRDGAGALVVRTDGRADVVRWGRDAALGPDVAVVRQNLDLLVDGGQLAAGLDVNDNPTWGRTIGHKTFVWRSAIGITADGALVYVAGDALTTRTIAQLEQDAGAVRAMELDINPSWTSFMTYQHPAPGVATPTKLTADEKPGAGRYLATSTRDFFAVYPR